MLRSRTNSSPYGNPSSIASSVVLYSIKIVVVLLFTTIHHTFAQIQCQDDSSCPPSSKCLFPEELCSNPYENGCLQAVLGPDNDYYASLLRVCNSDDPHRRLDGSGGYDGQSFRSSDNVEAEHQFLSSSSSSSSPLCQVNPLEYPEIRILAQRWQEPVFWGWVLQIILSEIAGVSATIETGSANKHASFYHDTMSFDYADQSYDYESLRVGNAAQDNICPSHQEQKKKMEDTVPAADGLMAAEEEETSSYVGCAHVMPEAWSGQRQAWREAEEEGLIESVSPNGRLAKYNWVIPKFVAEEDPTLVSFYGLSGPDKRRKLAERFKRPLSWSQYCNLISNDQCQTPDETAVRAPQDDDEGQSYFQRDLYRGYFMATAENDCDANPETCTGHIVDYGCQQSTYVKQQSHWLDIPLSSSGPLQPNGGYPANLISQIWLAANATNSSVIMYYANTNPFQLQFQNTPYQFQKIVLPEPSVQCLANRVTEVDRCSDDPVQQVGSPLGSCDTNPLDLKKYIVGSLRDNTFGQPEAIRSPAYDIIKAMEISTLDMLSIMKAWNHDSDSDYSTYYESREAVCHWVADNLENLTNKMIPRTYPRELQIQSFYDDETTRLLLFAALALGVLAVLLVSVSAGLTWLWSKRKVMMYAQPVFLNLILTGMLMVAVSAILYATPPSLGSCVARQWFSMLGFSMILVPLSVKVNAINQLFNSSKKMKRICIDKSKLYKTVLAVISFVVVYLVVWTVIDPPTKQSEAVLMKEDAPDNDDDMTIVQEVHYCASTNSQYWRIGSGVYLVVLLLVATVMATQSKNVISDFNETKYLAAMIYSHFLFVLLRFLIFWFGNKVATETWYTLTPGVTSLFLSLDAIMSLSIYFVPKFLAALSQPLRHYSGNNRSVAGSFAATLKSETCKGRHHQHHHDAVVAAFAKRGYGEDIKVQEEEETAPADSSGMFSFGNLSSSSILKQQPWGINNDGDDSPDDDDNNNDDDEPAPSFFFDDSNSRDCDYDCDEPEPPSQQ